MCGSEEEEGIFLIHVLERWPGLLLAGVALAAFISGCNRQDSDKDVMAKVNGYKVLRSEVDKSYNSQIAGSPQKPTPTEEQALRLNVLRQLIDVQLHIQKADKLGIVPTEDEVEEKLRQAKAPYTKEEFEKKLKDAGLTEDDYRLQIKRNLTIEKLLNKEIASRVTISDADIQSYYNQHKAEFNLIEPQYYLAHIVVAEQSTPQPLQAANKGQVDAQAHQRIDMVYNRLASGEDFASLAARYSDDSNTSRNGGELTPVPESSLKSADSVTRDAVLKLKAGEYTQPLPMIDPGSHQRIGYRILKLIGKEAAGQREFNDPAVQQWIRKQLRDQREQVLRTAYDESLRDGADIKNYYADEIVKNAGGK